MRTFVIALACFVLMGCVTSYSNISVTGTTKASLELQRDIVRIINNMETAYRPQCPFYTVNAKPIRRDGKTFVEGWTVKSCSQEIVYPVLITPGVFGLAHCDVKRPQRFEGIIK